MRERGTPNRVDSGDSGGGQDGNPSTSASMPSSRGPQHQLHEPTTPKRYHRREYEAGEFGGRESSHVPVAASPPLIGIGSQYVDESRRTVGGTAKATAAAVAPFPDLPVGRKAQQTANTTTINTSVAQRRTVTRITRTIFSGTAEHSFPPQVGTARSSSPQKLKRSSDLQPQMRQQEQQQQSPPATPASPTGRNTIAQQERGTPPRHPNPNHNATAAAHTGNTTANATSAFASGSVGGSGPGQILMRSPSDEAPESAQRGASAPDMKFYRITYRGVVALLSEPDTRSAKSGAYVSYGEIVATAGEEVEVLVPSKMPVTAGVETSGSAEEGRHVAVLGNGTSPETNSSTGMTMVKVIAIRVDDVLTGGYAIDADRNDHPPNASLTPRRSNLSDVGVSVPWSASSSACGSAFSALTSSDYTSLGGGGPPSPPQEGGSHASLPYHHKKQQQQHRDGCAGRQPNPSHRGFLFLTRRSVPIAVPLPCKPPICQPGPFLYKVVSSTPLPIIAGPCIDAPRTRAVVMPGTVHEVSLRVGGGVGSDGREFSKDEHGCSTVFLRLSHRRGWVADSRPAVGNSHGTTATPVMVELSSPEEHLAGDGGNSISAGTMSSYLSSAMSISTPSRRRRRPPLRRKRGITDSSPATGKLGGEHDAPSSGGTKSPAPPQHRDDGNFDYGYDYDVEGEAADPNVSPATPARRLNPAVAATVASSPVLPNVSILSEEEDDAAARSRNVAADGPERYAVEIAASASSDQQQQRQRQPTMAMSSSGSFSPGSRSRRDGETHVATVEPSFFLMRVTAPNGLKILDAPQFQVNNLIHGQALTTLAAQKGKADGAIFHTMAGSFANDPSIVRTDSTDSATRTRVLPRGVLFESSKRLEAAGVYTPGSGLIKLSDNSGWAIVPHREELDAQYRAFRGGGAGVREGEASRAYEEVGNAILDHSVFQPSRSQDESMNSTVWLRVVHRGGVLVSCPPPPPEQTDIDIRSTATGSPTSSTAGSAPASQIGMPSHETSSDVASSVASSFLDAMFRTPRKANAPPGGLQPNDSGLGSEKSFSQLPPRTTNPVLPCGLCVEVEPWEQTNGHPEQSGKHQSFAMLRGGQGWVPRHLNGESFAVIIDPPIIQYGSFWFRVKSKRGIKVRQGPSRKAASIKNEDGLYFRFECGEFLRSSEVCTVFGADERKEDQTNDRGERSECFVKLYRNSHLRSLRQIAKKTESEDGNLLVQPHNLVEHRPLDSLATPGEWVQVHANGKYYLEEVANPPKIERHRQGWRYNAVSEYGIPVRKGPSYLAEPIDKILRAGESVLINERVTSLGEAGSWLRLKDGHGWVHDIGENGEAVMIAHSLRYRVEGSKPSKARIDVKDNRRRNDDVRYDSVIARLFHDEEEPSGNGHQSAKSLR